MNTENEKDTEEITVDVDNVIQMMDLTKDKPYFEVRAINEKTDGIEIEVIKGDITEQAVDAIVNAAHENLTGGGGVDGAIHRKAGYRLLGECLNLYGCPTGEARITSGQYLPSKYVIHTVGPIYTPASTIVQRIQQEDDLKRCYLNSLALAEIQGLKTIAFPCISTGAFCFPKELAANIALEAIKKFAKAPHHFILRKETESKTYIDKVLIVCFDEENFEIYNRLLSK